MSDTKARELGLTPLARIVATGVSGLSPEIIGLGPIEAVRKALGNAGMSISDIDLFEINEAFAVQVLGSARELGIDEDKLNVSGGAIALGHPFGMTGARITATLLNNLATHDKTFGVETMCVGGGQAHGDDRWSGCPSCVFYSALRAQKWRVAHALNAESTRGVVPRTPHAAKDIEWMVLFHHGVARSSPHRGHTRHA